MAGAIALIVIVFALGAGFPAWIDAAALAVVLIALVIWDRLEARMGTRPGRLFSRV
jgi:hypothetical protein